jgi:hypothetical protein
MDLVQNAPSTKTNDGPCPLRSYVMIVPSEEWTLSVCVDGIGTSKVEVTGRMSADMAGDG